MTFENVPLPFDPVDFSELTGQQLVDAVKNGVDPRTGVEDDNFHDDLREAVLWGYEPEHTPIGTFEEVAEWSGGDQHPMGKVVRHVESNQFLLMTGIYSSWDGSDYDKIVVAEPYTFTETRYRKVKE